MSREKVPPPEGIRPAPPAAPRAPLGDVFDLSPMPAVISRIRDNAVLAISRRTIEVFGVAGDQVVGQTVTDYDVNRRNGSSWRSVCSPRAGLTTSGSNCGGRLASRFGRWPRPGWSRSRSSI
jgi:hypothetical protein